MIGTGVIFAAGLLALLASGIQSLFIYRHAVGSQFPVNLSTISYFVKENLTAAYFKLTAGDLQEPGEIPNFWLYADEKDINRLNSDLPRSGKVFDYPAYLRTDRHEDQWKTRFRYRGDMPMQWAYEKKSIRIKLPPFETLSGEQQFNFVVPPTAETIVDWISYDIARSKGLLTPDYYPIRLFLNDQYMGLHFYLSQVDESFLRKNQRMPGNIYSGDRIFDPRLTGRNAHFSHAIYQPDGGIKPLLWQDARLWSKKSARNSESAEDTSEIRRFIEISNNPDPKAFQNQFERLFDKDKFYIYFGLDTLFGTSHHDLFHNHKLYVDPYRGKYEPIEWDIRYWNAKQQAKDFSFYPLLERIKQNPLLEYERDLVGYGLTREFPTDTIVNRIAEYAARIRSDMAADPFRRAPIAHPLFHPNEKSAPLPMAEFDSRIADLANTYRKRHAYLTGMYRDTRATYTVQKIDEDSLLLNISVSGNSPIDLQLTSLVNEEARDRVRIVRQHMDQQLDISDSGQERLYPGRKRESGNAIGLNNNLGYKLWGDYKLVPSPLHYSFRFDGLSVADFDHSAVTRATNAVTGRTATLTETDELPSTGDTISAHPWLLQPVTTGREEQVVFSGTVYVERDQVYGGSQTVMIEPGTIFHIAPGQSLLFFGRVIALGTAEAPIRFLPQDEDKPWGSLVLQGKGANGSTLRHVEVSGGSVTRYGLVRYPGLLNIHDVQDFEITHCRIADNRIGDDAMHLAFSTGNISHCRFEDAEFDALDIDISTVEITDSVFVNSGNDALDLMTSKVGIVESKFFGAGDKCLSVGERSEMVLSNAALSGCNIGIAIKDGSNARLDNLHFSKKGEISIALYQKNSRYDKGGEVSGDRLSGITAADISVGSKSESHIPPHAFLPPERVPPAIRP